MKTKMPNNSRSAFRRTAEHSATYGSYSELRAGPPSRHLPTRTCSVLPSATSATSIPPNCLRHGSSHGLQHIWVRWLESRRHRLHSSQLCPSDLSRLSLPLAALPMVSVSPSSTPSVHHLPLGCCSVCHRRLFGASSIHQPDRRCCKLPSYGQTMHQKAYPLELPQCLKLARNCPHATCNPAFLHIFLFQDNANNV
jgi:hypothetical protein